MSTLAVDEITDALGGSTASINGLTPQASNMQPFNRIINGAMTIDQRNAGALINPATAGYTIDRWYYYQSQTSKGSIGQNAGAITPPTGFTNYLGFTSSSAYSITTTDQFLIQQKIEGFNISDLGWGAVGAQAITLSFWVYSSLTGTFGGALQNNASNRNYPFTYTISSANTWEQKTVTIAGDTTGTWLTTNGKGIDLNFSLGTGATYSATAGAWGSSSFVTSATGATSVVGTSGATFYITGVQLEAGSTASPFAHENVGDTLRKCQRYYYKVKYPSYFGTGMCYSAAGASIVTPFPFNLRSNPTALETSGVAGDYRVYNAYQASIGCTSVPVFANGGPAMGVSNFPVGGGLVAGYATLALFYTVNGFLAWSAEL